VKYLLVNHDASEWDLVLATGSSSPLVRMYLNNLVSQNLLIQNNSNGQAAYEVNATKLDSILEMVQTLNDLENSLRKFDLTVRMIQ